LQLKDLPAQCAGVHGLIVEEEVEVPSGGQIVLDGGSLKLLEGVEVSFHVWVCGYA
jgi:hypothetical protein